MSTIEEDVAAYQRGEPVNRSLPDLIHSAAKACEICFGDGLVCENHPNLPWESGSPADCHCGGAGMPCICTGLQVA